MKFKDVHN